MNWLTRFGLAGRALVYLRRIAAAQERQADAAESLAANDKSRWEREFVKPPPRVKLRIEEFDAAEAQRRYDRMIAAREEGIDYED